MKNTIAERVVDFLKNHPPFSMLNNENLFTIAQNVEILYFEAETYIFKKGQKVADTFYVVKDGAVGVYADDGKTLVDKCDEGDIFGLRALIRKDFYQLDAIAMEESIVYGVGAAFLETILENNEDAQNFVLTSFATYGYEVQASLDAANRVNMAEDITHDALMAKYSKNPVTCLASHSVQHAAQLMTENRVGSIVVTFQNMPIGIITDKDLRSKIATGKYTILEKVDKIMSSPVICFHEQITVAEAQVKMLNHGISHICITTDGTPQTQLIGVLSEHDIIVIHGNNPAALIKETCRANQVEQLAFIRTKITNLLADYLKQGLSMNYITQIISEMNDSICKRAIVLSLKEMETPPPVSFAWITLGSMGRGEQLLPTDQDNALIFENVSDDIYDKTKAYFVNLAQKVSKKLLAVGFEYCPAEMMASNSKWCLSLEQWRQQFEYWIKTPTPDNVMLCTIFFDYNLVFGNPQLVSSLTQHINFIVSGFDTFLQFLAKNAVQNPPPLGFFRNFLLEAEGGHKNQFDIKARALMPLTDAARLLSLANKIHGLRGTILRYKKLAEIEPQNAAIYNSCASAFKTLLRFRAQYGIKNQMHGRYIDLQKLSKSDKLKLRSAFSPIKEIQSLIEVRYMLARLI